MTALTLSFQETQFDVVNREGQPWLRNSQIGSALGYADQSSINRIFARNRDEFTDSMTASVKLTDPNGDLQDTRIFSLRGCHLLAMFARTKVAKEFRKWVLDILDKEISPEKATPKGALTPGEYAELLDKRGKIIVDRNDYDEGPINNGQQGILFNLMAIRFPEGRDRPYGWSRFQRHFVVSSYKNLPACKFAEACIYIPSMPDKEVKALPAPEQAKEITEWIDKLKHLDSTKRWMLYFGDAGTPSIKQIPDDACVMSVERLLEAINEPNGMYVSSEKLFAFVQATLKRLEHSYQYQKARAEGKPAKLRW